ncbi:MAG: translation initiation factor IF-3 [Rickettsiales bacterium]|jgi:translation initiation factor IF-3|nr:translation initiation factor IF-3 [Rickettsiales bacterium]
MSAIGQEPRVNQQIRVEKVRLIDGDGNMVGVVTVAEALKMGEAAGLDLVEVSPNAEPPVCKLQDYGKYKFALQKKANEARKKQKVIQVKEIKLRPMIDKHDLAVKMKAVHKFLDEGDKVKFTLRFRGREMSHQELGMRLLVQVKDALADKVKVESEPRLEGRQMVMMVSPAAR